MTVEEFRRLMEARFGPREAEADLRNSFGYQKALKEGLAAVNGASSGASDPSVVSFVKRDGVWEMPR